MTIIPGGLPLTSTSQGAEDCTFILAYFILYLYVALYVDSLHIYA